MSLHEFLVPRIKLLNDGSLIDFSEWETESKTTIQGFIATRICSYQKKGILDGEVFLGSGKKSIQVVRTSQKWKIISILWDDN